MKGGCCPNPINITGWARLQSWYRLPCKPLARRSIRPQHLSAKHTSRQGPLCPPPGPMPSCTWHSPHCTQCSKRRWSAGPLPPCHNTAGTPQRREHSTRGSAEGCNGEPCCFVGGDDDGAIGSNRSRSQSLRARARRVAVSVTILGKWGEKSRCRIRSRWLETVRRVRLATGKGQCETAEMGRPCLAFWSEGLGVRGETTTNSEQNSASGRLHRACMHSRGDGQLQLWDCGRGERDCLPPFPSPTQMKSRTTVFQGAPLPHLSLLHFGSFPAGWKDSRASSHDHQLAHRLWLGLVFLRGQEGLSWRCWAGASTSYPSRRQGSHRFLRGSSSCHHSPEASATTDKIVAPLGPPISFSSTANHGSHRNVVPGSGAVRRSPHVNRVAARRGAKGAAAGWQVQDPELQGRIAVSRRHYPPTASPRRVRLSCQRRCVCLPGGSP